jgi:16S rRNA processing protein RimM
MSPAQALAVAEHELALGYVSGVFGYKGEMRLFLYNRETSIFGDRGIPVVLVDSDGCRSERHMRTRSGAGKRILSRVDGVRTEADARALVDLEIVIPKALLPTPDEGEYYHHQLIGLPVREESGRAIGVLEEVAEGQDVDTWVVRGPTGENLIPAVRDTIVSVIPDEEIVIVDGWLEGSDAI